MNDPQRNASKRVALNESTLENATPRRRAYQRPEVATYDSKAIMQAVGPAHGIYGTIQGTAAGSL